MSVCGVCVCVSLSQSLGSPSLSPAQSMCARALVSSLYTVLRVNFLPPPGINTELPPEAADLSAASSVLPGLIISLTFAGVGSHTGG